MLNTRIVVTRYGETEVLTAIEEPLRISLKGRKGMDAVFDPIGGANWRRSLQTLSRDGRFVGYGYTSVLGDAKQEDWMNDWKVFSERKRTERGYPAYLYSITTLRKERPEWFREDYSLYFEKNHPSLSRLKKNQFEILACAIQWQSKKIGKVSLEFSGNLAKSKRSSKGNCL